MVDSPGEAAWLSQDGIIRVLLVEADSSGDTRYISNTGFTSAATDTPAKTAYPDYLRSISSFSTSLKVPDPTRDQMMIRASTGYGDVEIKNADGELDDWLNDAWAGRRIRIYIGDPAWTKAQFFQLLDGKIQELETSKSDLLTLKIKGRDGLLDREIQTNLLTGGPATDKPKPLCFGECYNISPVLIDKNTHTYQVHDGPINAITEVRDKGVPINVTRNLTAGTFSLVAAPAGKITADVQGAKPATYLITAADIVQHMIVTYANLTTSDIDTDSFINHRLVASQTVGLYVRAGGNLKKLIDTVLGSVGSFIVRGRDGLLKLRQFTAPSGDPVLSLTSDDIYLRSFQVRQRIPPVTRIQAGYKHNWTVQDADNLAGAVTEENRAFFAQENRAVSDEDATVLIHHPEALRPDLINTLLAKQTEAQAECTRWLHLYSQTRTVYQLTTSSQTFQLQLGDVITITHQRFGFANGLQCVVIGIDEDYKTNRSRLTVWR